MSIYTKEQQTRTITNEKTGKTKTGSGKATGTSPTAGRDIRSKQFIGKKLNMGGVMKNRGGTFKGVY